MSNTDKELDPNYIRAREIIIGDLQFYDNYEDKNKYMQTLDPKKKRVIANKFPDLEKEINEHMITSIINDFGDPHSDQFTFSKEISDTQLIRDLKKREVNRKYLENFQVDITPELSNELKDLNYDIKDQVTGEWIEVPFSQSLSEDGLSLVGTEAFNALVGLKNEQFGEVEKEIGALTGNIQTLREEFDDRASVLKGPLRTTPFPWMPEVAKGAMQVSAGWMDWFAKEGLEQVENRKLNWDPVNERYGPGPEIAQEQRKLRDSYRSEDKLKDKFLGIDTKYDELNDMINSSISRANEINEQTGIDEALNYIESEAKILEILGDK